MELRAFYLPHSAMKSSDIEKQQLKTGRLESLLLTHINTEKEVLQGLLDVLGILTEQQTVNQMLRIRDRYEQSRLQTASEAIHDLMQGDTEENHGHDKVQEHGGAAMRRLQRLVSHLDKVLKEEEI